MEIFLRFSYIDAKNPKTEKSCSRQKSSRKNKGRTSTCPKSAEICWPVPALSFQGFEFEAQEFCEPQHQ